MRVSEIFQSIQGEGEFAGTSAVFVRTTGCNLRCWFCDADYTSWRPEGVTCDWTALLEQVQAYDCKHVVLTGGEPLLQPDAVPLTHALHELGLFVTIETAATVDRPVAADLMSISPKLSNSTPTEPPVRDRHERDRQKLDVVQRFTTDYPYQFKFVIDAPQDVPDVEAYLAHLPHVPRDRVFLMPQARSAEELAAKADWVASAAEARGYRFSPRLHLELFGNVRGR